MNAEPDGGAPSSAEDRLRMTHRECRKARGHLLAGPGQCYDCLQTWPCDVARVLAELDAARRALELAYEWMVVPADWETSAENLERYQRDRAAVEQALGARGGAGGTP